MPEVTPDEGTLDVLPDIPEDIANEEEASNAETVEEPEAVQQVEEPKLSAEEKLEQDARAKGWKPVEEWEADGHDTDGSIHLNPKEFLSQRWIRSKLRDTERTVRAQNKELANLKGRHDFLTEHYEKLSENSRKEEIAKLQERRREYEEDGNIEDARRMDDEIVEVASRPAKEQQPVVDPSQGVVFEQWLGRNQWYVHNQELQDYAKQEGDKLYAERPELSEEQFLNTLAEMTKQAHPEVFGIKPKIQRKPPVVDNGGAKRKVLGGEEMRMADFSSEEQEIIRTAVAMGTYKNEQEYINKLVKTGVFK